MNIKDTDTNQNSFSLRIEHKKMQIILKYD